ncbi:WAS/WASL-interacting protein family member 3 [Suncus etruscus]|uniref:WAS/WASL-interacting protein family member 3 n=1 Tax=Suncus etruscus TaxID=109475 RepID=UPI00211038D9|nr:WAS/WASL-interacting protein family member 3 [Suncus etruscus]
MATASTEQINTDTPILRKADAKGRSALLADIQKGTRLRKVTQINDRSAPQIESSKGTNKEGGGATTPRGGSTPPALGDLFAGGFPGLRPTGQRDVAGGKTGPMPGSLAPSPRLPSKTPGTPSHPAASPRPAPPRPSVPAPPPPPPLPAPTPAKAPQVPAAPPPPPPLPGDRTPKTPLAPLPTPPPLPLLPPCGYPGPPPPPPLPLHAPCAPRSSSPAPPVSPKSPSYPAPPNKPSAQPLPGVQPLPQKKRPGRGPGTSGGKLNPPPAPPARSPTTELSSRSQQAWPLSQQAGGQLKNGNLHTADDFETKFTFHSVEDFPPPDEYKPCQKIYPSKIPRSHTPGPWLQAEATGPGSDDARGRNSQSALKTLR